jgi:hypothetical protein
MTAGLRLALRRHVPTCSLHLQSLVGYLTTGFQSQQRAFSRLPQSGVMGVGYDAYRARSAVVEPIVVSVGHLRPKSDFWGHFLSKNLGAPC